MNKHIKRFIEWRNRMRSIRKLKRDIRATVGASLNTYKGEVRAVTFEQVRFVVYQLDGTIRFVARNLHATFGEIVENACQQHAPVFEFERLRRQHERGSVAYRLLKRFA